MILFFGSVVAQINDERLAAWLSRFCNSMRSDADGHRCQIDLAQEPQEAKKEAQHRRDEQQGYRKRRVKTQEGAQEENRNHGAYQERCGRTQRDGASVQFCSAR